MKKLIFFLLLAPMLFASCSSDDDCNCNTYLDNKLIEGQWEHLNGQDSTVFTFKNNTATEVTYDKYILTTTSSFDYGQYKLTSNKIVYLSGDVRPYKLANDTLYYYDAGGNIYTPYVKVKE